MSTFSKQWDSSSALSDIQSRRALIAAIISPFTLTPTCPYGMKNDGKFGFIAVQDRLLTKRWNTSPTQLDAPLHSFPVLLSKEHLPAKVLVPDTLV